MASFDYDVVIIGLWRFLNHFWIGAETTDAARSILYFGGQGAGSDMLRLLAWTGVIVAALLLPISRKLARQREGSVVTTAFRTRTPRLAEQA